MWMRGWVDSLKPARDGRVTACHPHARAGGMRGPGQVLSSLGGNPGGANSRDRFSLGSSSYYFPTYLQFDGLDFVF